MPKMYRGHLLRAILSYLALSLFCLFAVYPITRIITIALRPSDQLLSSSLALIPAGATFGNFRILITETVPPLAPQFHCHRPGR